MPSFIYRHNVQVLALTMVAAGGNFALAQQSIGRGAPDPLVPEVLVGTETKGWWAGAGIPPEYPPIFATQRRRDTGRRHASALRYLQRHRFLSGRKPLVRPALL